MAVGLADPVGAVDDRAVLWLSDQDLVARADSQFAEWQAAQARWLETVAEIDARGLAGGLGATCTAALLRERFRISRHTARQEAKLAQRLRHLPAMVEALKAGRMNVEQAASIGEAIAQLPAAHSEAVEAKLVEFAADFGPEALSTLGQRALEHVAPEVAEEHERREVEREERRASKQRFFSLRAEGPFRVRVSGLLDNEAAATISAALEPLCSPSAGRNRPAAGSAAGSADGSAAGSADGLTDDGGDERTAGARRADALVAICGAALAGGGLPKHGGQRAQVMVTMPFEPWHQTFRDYQGNRSGTQPAGVVLPVGRLFNGRAVSGETLRRMCCDAGLIPVVLGGEGQVLDLGRQRRLFPEALRKALFVRDRGCTWPGCDYPATFCDCHHVEPWSNGGTTSLNTGVMICRRHHVRIHHGDWTVHIGSDGLPYFIPPPYVDPEQRPRRNQYWRRT